MKKTTIMFFSTQWKLISPVDQTKRLQNHVGALLILYCSGNLKCPDNQTSICDFQTREVKIGVSGDKKLGQSRLTSTEGQEGVRHCWMTTAVTIQPGVTLPAISALKPPLPLCHCVVGLLFSQQQLQRSFQPLSPTANETGGLLSSCGHQWGKGSSK